MAQRIRWIDQQFLDRPRVMLRISVKHDFRAKRRVLPGQLVVERVNLFTHFFRILYLAFRSDVIYVHSCNHALTGLPLYYLGRPVVTDMHGAVPEELAMMGCARRKRLLEFVEKIVLQRSSALVFVTDAMRRHFRAKYPKIEMGQTYTIPIVGGRSRDAHTDSHDPSLVIYAGGMQTWQRVDVMMDAAKRTGKDFRFVFLTADLDKAKAEVTRYGLTNVEVRSVPPKEVEDYYERASLGFILREDSVVNRVACPTKLVEYLWCGVVPIVEQPIIGDFVNLGYKYVLLEDFINKRVPSPPQLDEMRLHNRRIAEELQVLSMQQVQQLRADFLRDRV